MVAVDKASELLNWAELEDVEGFSHRYFRVGLFCAFGNFDSNGLENSIQEEAKVLRERVLIFEGEYFAIVSFLDSVVEQKDIVNVVVLQLLGNDWFELGVELLGFIGGKQEQQVDCGDHSMELRLLADEDIFIEKFDIIDGILDPLCILWGKGVKQVELGISHCIW